MHVWNGLQAARRKYRIQKWRENRHLHINHRTTLSGYIFATKACIDNRKKLVKQQYLFHCSHNMLNFRPLTAESVRGFGPGLCTMFGRLHDCYTIYYTLLGGSCPLMEFCQVQNSPTVQVLRSPIFAALLHVTPAAGVSQTVRSCMYNEWNCGTFAEGATYSTGRPSRWSSADILQCVSKKFPPLTVCYFVKS